MRLTAAIMLALLMVFGAGCSAEKPITDDKIDIVCTMFPQYDWARSIIGDDLSGKYNLTLLLDGRVDLHSYTPSVRDIAAIKTCDVFVYTGGDSEYWAEGVLKDADGGIRIISLMELLGERVVYGEHAHDEDGHDEDGHDEGEHDEDEDHEDHDEEVADEHVWLSLKNALFFCEEIASVLTELDSANARVYQDNLEAYSTELAALDSLYAEAVRNSAVSTLVFADRFPFRYLADDYGIDYFAAFEGCSAETEAGFATIISLANTVDELALGRIMVTESCDQTIARTVINNTSGMNQSILIMDSMQSVTVNDAQNGTTYLSIMEKNLDVLREALN